MRDVKIMTKKELREKHALELLDESPNTLQPRRGIGPRGRGPGSRGQYYEKPKHIRRTVARLISYLGIYKLWISLIAFVLILGTIATLSIPFMFSRAIDNYLVPADPARYLRIVPIAIAILAIAFVNSLIRFIARFVMVRIAQRIVKKIRNDAFSSLMKAPLSYYDEKGAGDTVSRLSNDVELINATLSQTVIETINSLIMIIGAVVYMFILNWALAIVVILFVPIMAVFTVFISKRTRKGFKEEQRYLASLNGIIEENIAGLKAVKLYNQEAAFTEDFSGENDKLKAAGFKAQVYAGILMPFIHFMNNLIYLTVIAIGAALYLYAPFAVTIGHIAGVSQYSRTFIMPIANLAQMFNTLMQAVAGAERVFELIDVQSEYDPDGEDALEGFTGKIELDNVDFSYTEGVPVLKRLTFKAEPGELIAIVGPTGGGKTTTINLINRFYDIDSGRILIDGKPIETIQKDRLRQRIGVVLQDTKLFTGTILENIHYGDFSKPTQAVYEAAQKANAHDFISKLPQGYETAVQEGGENLSQGERQLISIARTILNNPDLLILDEATSNIDTRTEAKIRQSMDVLMKGRTSIVIAHRLQTIERADKIIVIHAGEMIEHGTHETLLANQGFYYNLYRAQFES